MINLKIKKLKTTNKFNLPSTVDELVKCLSSPTDYYDILSQLKKIYHLDLSHTLTFEYLQNDGSICKLYICPQYHPYGILYLSCMDIYADIPHKSKIGSIGEIASVLQFSESILGKHNVLINELANIVENVFSTYSTSNHELGRHIISKLENSNTYIEFLTSFEKVEKDYIKCLIRKKI